MSDLYRYKTDVSVRATLDAASSPNNAIYYWEDSGEYYTSKAHMNNINATGAYTVDVNSVMATLEAATENEDILEVQEGQIFNSIAQTAYVEVTNNVYTTANEETDETTELLRIDFTPKEKGNKLIVNFTASATSYTNSDRTIVFHLFIGETGSETFKRGTKIFSDKWGGRRSGSCALTYCGKIESTNAHSVLIKWGQNGSGSAAIRAQSDGEYEHASLVIQEVRA